MIASIVGPNVIVQELQISYDVIEAWLMIYRSKIIKAARKTMKRNPPLDRTQTVYLSLIEYVTESWRTIFIQTKENPSPVALAWKTVLEYGTAAWNIIELPCSDTLITAGIGSYPVLSFKRYLLREYRITLNGELEVMASLSRSSRDWKTSGYQS
jgi:hypothetical protein